MPDKYVANQNDVTVRERVPLLACVFDLAELRYKVHKLSWQAFIPPLKEEIVHLDVDKKVPQTIRASVFTSSPQMGNARFERTTFQTLSRVLLMLWSRQADEDTNL